MADEQKHAGGRPMAYDDAGKLATAVDAYFASTLRPTLAGLAYALGIDRQTLYNYKERDEFIDIMKRARDRVEVGYEERLIYDNQPTGVIFALKNMGWKDKTEQDLNVTGEAIQIIMPPSE
jgi:hypothetical protein